MVRKHLLLSLCIVLILTSLVWAPADNASTTATTNATTTSTTSADSLALALLKQQVNSLDSETELLKKKVDNLKDDIAALNSDVKVIKAQQGTIDDVKKDVSSVSTGLAGLQDNLKTTKGDLKDVEEGLQKEKEYTNYLTWAFFIVLAAAAGLTLYWIMTKKQTPQSGGISKQALDYINAQITQGRKYSLIKQNLLQAGWTEEDVSTAYKMAVQRTSSPTLGSSTQSLSQPETASSTAPSPQIPGMDKNKVMMVSIFTIIVILGIIFVLKGVTTGHAIFFQNQDALEKGVKDALEKNIDQNQFYAKIEEAAICVQVQDGEKDVSYKITKSAYGHQIKPADIACYNDPTYDLAFKFNNWQAFDFLVNDLNCDNARKVHSTILKNKERGVYILPSKYVLPGFKKNPEINNTQYVQYCTIFDSCLKPTEKAILGC